MPRCLISRFDVRSVLWHGKTHYGAGRLRPRYVQASHQSNKTAIASYDCGDEPDLEAQELDIGHQEHSDDKWLPFAQFGKSEVLTSI